MSDYIERFFKYRTEHYDIDEDWSQYSISIDRNPFESINISIFEKDQPIHTALTLWFDRKTTLKIVNDLIECLANYPEDQKERMQRDLDCCCKSRIDREAE